MHSLRGAFSETVYIYGQAIQKTLEHGLPPHFFSLGLGLGYNELLTTALLISWNKQQPTLQLNQLRAESFEALPELTQLFVAWLKQEKIRNDFETAYSEILKRCSETTAVDPERIRTTLLRWIESKNWLLQGTLDSQTKFTVSPFSCFLFDAFSSKTSPELWSEDFLTELFSTSSAAKAVFSTYACTGALKRSLTKCGFTLNIREGFASKRDCTFALKGLL